MKKKSRFLRNYYILAVLFAIIGLLDSTLFSDAFGVISKSSYFWMGFVMIFNFIILVLSIIAIIIFIREKLPKKSRLLSYRYITSPQM